MPKSIAEAQQNILGDLGSIGDSRDIFTAGVKSVFNTFGRKFLTNLSNEANSKGVVASGKLLSDSKFTIEGGTMKIIVPDYYDFPNEGVRGVKSSKNAPGSPYKYKNYGMNEEGRTSIKKYIASGHAKIDLVRKRKDKALGIGLEKKRLSVADMRANQLIYLIKAYGIKKTGYFTEALNKTFINSDFEAKMTEEIGKSIVFTLEKLNRK